ncbi:MAG: hypothetical protein KJ995_08305 [Candidatus Omnitrophica bacterium]|nr:hypothetical protein [Candidatus Omnitrophota bacterium]MBU1127553.1 hypothetical protein [Candidatus Omnitrophota bacterium]MBU1785278.1 hypothetical protein [Candidatus Omnitrophota bacterium]MBU1852389.1 hypothetical protein [Candidatus Omnitrophota bacterium]
MSRYPTWLLEHKRDVYSQTGEDGIIEKILEIIPNNDKWCIEFGAWDGLFLTNTRHLIESKGYSAVLIEADKKKFGNLQRNYSHRNNIILINKFVGFGEHDNLDQILCPAPVPYDFDLLSIDIDGNDYHVWKAFSKYRPKLIVVEFNPTIPTHMRFIQPADPSINQGASLLSLVELGKEKGYELVSVLPFNAFFVRREDYPLFQIESNGPGVLRTSLDHITYLFSGYDGRMFLHGGCTLPWHGIDLRESRLQHLPRFLRKYPGNYTSLQKGGFALFLLYTRPSRFIQEFRERSGRLMKQIIKKMPLYYFLHNWVTKRKYAKELIEWERKGKPVPPPHIVKQQTLQTYAMRYGLKILVETGTFYGDMVEAMKGVFDRLYTIEIDEELYEKAKKRFKGVRHIELIHGDSGVELMNLMNKINEPALFWLDGHYSGGVTAKGEKDTPIYEELRHILNAPDRGHVIIIDDARCFGADPVYPSIEKLKDFIKSKRPNLEIIIQDDNIRITPKQ